MLILTRKVGESIVIHELGIVVTVLESKGNKIRLGISAPDKVSIHREEVWDRVRCFLSPSLGSAVKTDKLRQ